MRGLRWIWVIFILPAFLTWCSKKEEGSFKLIITDKHYEKVGEFFRGLGLKKLSVEICNNISACVDKSSINIVIERMDCPECYVIEDKGDHFVVKGGYILGIIYGVVYLLEAGGFRFPHPFFFVEPNKVDKEIVRRNLMVERVFEPEIALRGLHLHTLHPIEALFSFHVPAEDIETSFIEAKKIIDWIVLQRGNFVQWAPLGDIKEDERFQTWKLLNQRIVEYAHSIGVRVGVNVQIFAVSSLQNAYLLTEDKDYGILEIPFDVVTISFGEFFAEEPEKFIREVNSIYGEIKKRRPDIEVHAVVHVGNFEKLRVEYRGEKLLYYFLVKYADQEIIPLVHTVMFYNLFDKAGGAYNHSDFKEHRDFLFELYNSGRKVGYKPETAYWVAFDNPVPLYLPIYLKSRWIDLHEILEKEKAKIYAHVIFSSGWEWGYWMYDYASLRMSYTLPETFHDILKELFSPSPYGREISELIKELAEVQYEYLLRKELAQYLAGEDFYVDFACNTKVIISQPCRISFDEVKEMTPEQREKFSKEVVEELKHLEQRMKKLSDIASSIGGDGRWNDIVQEIKDGVRITYLRTVFIRNLYEGILAYMEHKNVDDYISNAESIIGDARKITESRSANFFYPRRQILVESINNPTIYDYGYLKQAHTLCLWQRDLEEFKKAIGRAHNIPTCIH